MIRILETIFFRGRVLLLAFLGVVTVIMGYQALQLRMDAGFFKGLPTNHPYIETFREYQDRLFGANRVIIVLRNTKGDIWNQQFLKTLHDITQDIFYLPGVDRRTVTSLWTPNTRILEITEDGISARDVIPGKITADEMEGNAIKQLKNDVLKGNLVGRLVSNDFTASLVVTELLEYDPATQKRLDYIDLGEQLEKKIRGKFEKDGLEVHIIGFAKNISDIAKGGIESAPPFFLVAFILTVLSLYFYCRDWKLTWLTVLCSATSVVWQFGMLTLFGYGLDPLAILVPFLVFAIGTSHGVQQLNMITAELAHGSNAEQAGRSSFRGLLVPGSISLITDVVGFAALIIVPIPQIQELAITASIGTALKIVTNLIMLPVLVTYMTFPENYRERVAAARESRLRYMKLLAVFGRPAVAFPVSAIFFGLFVFSVIKSGERHIGDLHPGSPELHPNARYNVDARIISEKFSVGLDLLTIVVETPPQSCINYDSMNYLNEFSWYMRNVDGVRDVQSAPFTAKQVAAGWNEGNLKWRALPRNQYALVQAIGPIPPSSGLIDVDCTILPIQVFLIDGKAETIKTVVQAVKDWNAARGLPPILSAGHNYADMMMPPQYLADGKARREPAKPTSIWAFKRSDTARVVYTAPGSLKADTQSFKVKGYGAPPQGDDKALVGPAIEGAETTIDVVPGPDGKADIDMAAIFAKPEFANAEIALVDGVPDSFTIRLASGNSGVAAAVNETIHDYELPSVLIVYAVVIFLTYITYFDWRAAVGCCLPLTYATFFGYYFMLELDIGLKVSTLPVIVLVVGIGIDYAYYIYNRLQYHLSRGVNISDAYTETALETGNGVFYTALNFAVGVSTWAFSPLKFQADMGLLLTFMFMTNMVMALTALPGLAVVIDTLIPRKKLPYAGPEPGGHWQ
ncbi:MAG: MMPL family transporter [Alphaproteobacteria bacterium]|nr:MMPL family transporter [Alphaproteobacteria bacterium]